MLVPTLPTLLSATIITVIISIVFVVLIDEPVQRLRVWIKAGSRPKRRIDAPAPEHGRG